MAIDWDAAVIGPCMEVFGEAITYLPAAGGAWSITGVFDDAYLAVVLGDDGDPAVATVDPVLGVQLSQFPALPLEDDRLTVLSVGKTYMVANVQPDGKGAARLVLQRTADVP